MVQMTQPNFTKPRATKPLCNRIAIVFDFDDTLVPDTFDGLIKRIGLDVNEFRKTRLQPLIEDGWDAVAARFYSLIQESKQRDAIDRKITKDFLIKFGQDLEPFDGVTDMFDRLHQRVHELNAKVELEFYLITGGFGEVARSSCVAHYFTRIWGCEFKYGEHDEIEFLKRSISHTEKTRYLFEVSRGTDNPEENGRSFAYRDVPQEELHIPLSQVIYVGDGASDIPCFSLINDERGIAIGVYKTRTAEEWSHEIQVSESQRVTNLAPADYREDSELMRSLTLAVESICKQIELLQLGKGE